METNDILSENISHNQNLFAEFTGILLGDGSLSVYKSIVNGKTKFQHRLKVTLDSREQEYTKYVANLLEKLFFLRPLIRFKKEGNVVDIILFDKRIVNFLIDKGFAPSPKWNRAIIPESLLKSNLEKQVIKGYFDTDGSVVIANNNGTQYPRLELKVCPSPMQSQLTTMLAKLGFHFGVYQIGRGEIRIQLNGKEQLRKWHSEIGFGNERHLKKAELFLKNQQ
jgi:hypothetical protein